ncbi:MAG: Crp/Fnr family transcriptional regulator [Tenuifilaceae bacterium]|nr:Crp/Fnr family transcriptional regulator [Tenuifilaceae bacterium]
MNEMKAPKNQDNDELHFRLDEILTSEEWERLASSSNRMEYNKRDTIIKQGSRVTEIAIIVSGIVKVTREMRKGKNLILRIAMPGSFLGISSALSSENYDYSVCALEPTVVQLVDIYTFRFLISENKAFANEVMNRISADNLFNIGRLSSLLSKQLPGRVADIILYFSEDIFGSPKFSIPLTRQELAELAGTTKESLIRTLSEFKHDKIIDMSRNGFSINSLNILKTLSRLG